MLIERDVRELSNVSSHQFPDRSTKWLIRQREHLEALVRMVGGDIADAFDFANVKQLNRSFISDELRTQESDMIFRVPFQASTQRHQEVIVYLLIEHQSTVDRSMGLRVLSYMVQIWMEERRQWEETKRPQGRVGVDSYRADRLLHRHGRMESAAVSDGTHGHPRSPDAFRPDLRHLAP